MTAPGRNAGVLRSYLLRMMIWVVVIHGVFVALYHAAGIAAAEPRLRMLFTATWTAATFVPVSIYLRRIRQARRAARAPRAPTRA